MNDDDDDGDDDDCDSDDDDDEHDDNDDSTNPVRIQIGITSIFPHFLYLSNADCFFASIPGLFFMQLGSFLIWIVGLDR